MASLEDYEIDSVKNSIVAVAQDTAAIVTATVDAQPARHLVFMKCDASYSTSTQSGELTILFGTTIVARKHCHGQVGIDMPLLGFQNPTVNQKIEAKLSAGAGGVIGDVVLTCYSTGPNA